MVGFLKTLGFKIESGQDDYVPYIICTEKSVTVGRHVLDWLGFLGPLTRQKAEFLHLTLFTPTVSVTLNRTTMMINTTSLKSFIFSLSHATAARLWSHLSLVELAISKYHEYRIAHMETQTDTLMEILMQRPLNQPASGASSTRSRGSSPPPPAREYSPPPTREHSPPAREHRPPPAYSEIPIDMSSQHRTIEILTNTQRPVSRASSTWTDPTPSSSRGPSPPPRQHSPPPAYSEIPNDVSSQRSMIESPPPSPANNETSDEDMLHSNENDDQDQESVSSRPSPAPVRLRLECDESMPGDSGYGGGGGEERNESARQRLVGQLISRAVHLSLIQFIHRRRQHRVRVLRSRVRDA